MYSNNLVCDILNYLNNNINKEITIDELVSIFYFDRTYIMKRFKKDLGISIVEYLNTIRVFNSLSYYKDDNYVLSIAFKNGFNSIEYYSETFKKVIGVSPKIYKKFIFYKMISEKEYESIVFNITRISDIKRKIDIYLNNKKPVVSPVKTLGVKFK